jgi:uncharacterized protein
MPQPGKTKRSLHNLRGSLLSSNSISKRNEFVDYLRGFALFGVIYMHVIHFGAFRNIPNIIQKDLLFSSFDNFLFDFSEIYIKGKFLTIFAVLYGFYLNSILKIPQMRESLPKKTFYFFILGFVHSLFFYLDILMLYSICTFLIFLGIKIFKLRILNLFGFSLSIYLFMILALQYLDPNMTLPISNVARLEYPEISGFEIIKLLRSNDHLMKIKFNLVQFYYYFKTHLFSLHPIQTFINIQIGLILSLFYNKIFKYRKILLFSSLAISVLLSILLHSIKINVHTPPLNVLESFFRFIRHFYDLNLATAWTFFAYFLYKKSILLIPLSSFGKMSLTIYLLESVVFYIIFYVFGVSSTLSLFSLFSIATIMILVLVLFAQIYFKKNTFGPIEKLLRN